MGKDRSYVDDRGRTVTIRGGKHYFNERTGGNNGRLHDDQFSIDGRSWDYRDPRNQREIDRANVGRERGNLAVNPQSDRRYDDLYNYDFGTVRDAARSLGIGNVDEGKEVRQILEYIQEGRGKKEKSDSAGETKRTVEPLLPRGERVPRFNEPLAQARGMSDSSAGGTDANTSAIRGGDDLNEWFQNKLVPHAEADANATNSEIGDDSRYFLDKFAFEPPKLGDIKELFDKYKDEIEDLD
mgnify:CR=1 FL=1|tara:strand:+ start:3022 stop:3741 length:720 start_codon:yes stop_codon:yes gene_type:complete